MRNVSVLMSNHEHAWLACTPMHVCWENCTSQYNHISFEWWNSLSSTHIYWYSLIVIERTVFHLLIILRDSKYHRFMMKYFLGNNICTPIHYINVNRLRYPEPSLVLRKVFRSYRFNWHFFTENLRFKRFPYDICIMAESFLMTTYLTFC